MPKKTKSQEIIEHGYKGLPFSQRKIDGYYNATEMCIACGKLFNDYSRLKRTKSFLETLSVNTGIPVLELVISKTGGAHEGTYIHPKVAINLAQWISSDFEVFVTNLVFSWMSGETQSKPKPIKPIRSPERQKATDATKSLNEVIMEKLCQEPQHIFIHVENSLHAGITGMSATHHKKVTGGSNSVDLINNIEQNIYSCAKNMLLEKLLTHENNSLTRSQIRDLAIDVRAFCESLVGNLENQGYLNNNRYLPLLPETKRKMHSLH